MSKQVIHATGFQMATSADGKMCLAISSGTGTFDVYFAGNVWAKLGQTAAWFEREQGPAQQIALLIKEREEAIEKQVTLAHALRKAEEDLKSYQNGHTNGVSEPPSQEET